MTRSLFVAASPGLMSSLAEQFEALGLYELRALHATEPAAPWPHAAILDAEAFDASALARRLRASGFAGPIIAIGAEVPEADAALPRPFRFTELLTLLAAAPSSGYREGFDARLTEKEAAILRRLAQARGAIISKEALLADVWGYGPNVSTRTLETHIHRLRRKIEADPQRPLKLLTEDGGYRLANIGEQFPAKFVSP
ncbi:winged helix-turn-helix domain-containing protein [Methylocystis sp. JAN1]|uniref:winged helix-turn-helix domain-containing protein n=1 Tax=Methylocystis sp. JAN1 TaxID=3397211 RepID=UPI003FA24A34